MSYYDYQELRARAMETRSTEDINALGEWMDNYGMDDWNGEVFDIGDGYSLRPIYEPYSFDDNGEPDQWDTVGYELI